MQIGWPEQSAQDKQFTDMQPATVPVEEGEESRLAEMSHAHGEVPHGRAFFRRQSALAPDKAAKLVPAKDSFLHQDLAKERRAGLFWRLYAPARHGGRWPIVAPRFAHTVFIGRRGPMVQSELSPRRLFMPKTVTDREANSSAAPPAGSAGMPAGSPPQGRPRAS